MKSFKESGRYIRREVHLRRLVRLFFIFKHLHIDFIDRVCAHYERSNLKLM